MLPSNSAAVADYVIDVTSRRVVRYYRLLSRCSSRHVRITSMNVDAGADYSDIYGQFNQQSSQSKVSK